MQHIFLNGLIAAKEQQRLARISSQMEPDLKMPPGSPSKGRRCSSRVERATSASLLQRAPLFIQTVFPSTESLKSLNTIIDGLVDDQLSPKEHHRATKRSLVRIFIVSIVAFCCGAILPWRYAPSSPWHPAQLQRAAIIRQNDELRAAITREKERQEQLSRDISSHLSVRAAALHLQRCEQSLTTVGEKTDELPASTGEEADEVARAIIRTRVAQKRARLVRTIGDREYVRNGAEMSFVGLNFFYKISREGIMPVLLASDHVWLSRAVACWSLCLP